MNDNEEKIPPFIQDYLNKMDHEGYADFVNLSREFHIEREEYPGKYATQSAHLHDHNRRTGQNKALNYEDGLKGIETRYKQRAYQTAKQHGYKGPDPNQPSDREFTKQGEKFQGMIDSARQRQQEQAKQPEQKQEAETSHEKKNIEALKEQRPYRQDQPNVEFKGAEQPQASGTASQEQRRAAFMAEVKKTREQQTQQQDKTPEF